MFCHSQSRKLKIIGGTDLILPSPSYYFHFIIVGHRARIAGHFDRVPAIIYITDSYYFVVVIVVVVVERALLA